MSRATAPLVTALCIPWLLAAGCDTDSAQERVAVVATYNIGLATGFVDYAAQRRPQVVTLLAGLDADLVCLQEVWTQDDVDAVIAGTTDAFPYHHYEYIEDHTLGPPACEDELLATLRTCVEAECGDVPSGELGGCVLDKCNAQFFATSAACQGCLAAKIGQDFDTILTACTEASELYTYSGANGLLMLSKVPLSNLTHAKLDSSLTQRSVLGASATLPKLGAVDFFCTHIAADLTGSITYNGDYESFEGENIHQIGEITAFIDTNATAGATPILAGDFNSGPEVAPDITAELPSGSYAVLTQAGWTSLSVGDAPVCSYCADNRLIADTHASTLIDHVFVKGLSGAFDATATRIGTESISVDDNGTAVETNPSDHYGFRVQLDYRP